MFLGPTMACGSSALGGAAMNARPKCFVERRQSGRRQTFFHGMITGTGRRALPCIVRDLSAGGAKIQLEMATWLPSRFRLVMEGTLRSDCQIVHRSNDAVSVRFLTSNDDLLLSPPIHVRNLREPHGRS